MSCANELPFFYGGSFLHGPLQVFPSCPSLSSCHFFDAGATFELILPLVAVKDAGVSDACAPVVHCDWVPL